HSGVRRWLFHPLFRLSQHDEAGDVALNILDIFLDDVQTIELGREPGGEGRHGTLLLLGHQARRARGIAGDYRFPAVLADEFATLAQRVNVAVHAADFLALHAWQHHELEMDRQKILARYVEPGLRQKIVNVCDPACNGVLDRNHGQVGLAGFDSVEGVLEGGAGQRLDFRKHVAAGGIGIGPRLALEGNSVGLFRHLYISMVQRESSLRARSRSCGVSTPSGTDSTISASIRMPASSARNCSRFSRFSSTDGASDTTRASEARR